MTQYTYIGRRVELVAAFCEGDQVDTYTFWPKAKASVFAGAVIGSIYEFPDGAVPPLWTPAKVGQVDADQAAIWQGADRAAYLSTQERKADASPQLTQALATLRAARNGVGHAQRLSFDLWVLQSIKG